jgi:hypothetical protein
MDTELSSKELEKIDWPEPVLGKGKWPGVARTNETITGVAKPVSFKITCHLEGEGITDEIRKAAEECIRHARWEFGQWIAELQFPESD